MRRAFRGVAGKIINKITTLDVQSAERGGKPIEENWILCIQFP